MLRKLGLNKMWPVLLAIGCFAVLGLGGINRASSAPSFQSPSCPEGGEPPPRGPVCLPEPITDISGFAWIDRIGNSQDFESLMELESWVRERVDLDPGKDIALFRQQRGDKAGLLVFIGSEEFVSTLLEDKRIPFEPTTPAPTVPPSKMLEQARLRVLEITGKGPNVSLTELDQLQSSFNLVAASGPDQELTKGLVQFLRDFYNSQGK